MLTIAEQQRVKRIRRSLTKLHLQVTVSKGEHSPAELRTAVDNLCRVGEMLAGMHLLEDQKLPLREIEERIRLAEGVLLKREPVGK
ncbi:hypothetical protein [Kroppenstedtia eburnea]|uniref:hypothetical protein n=1 Tax=Kroppenstedtia eburnea TaxID=714067 RepID=UPI00020C8952|nr:hypothetical protein [Kroppenstedtia eburnea]EGK08768.1 hypothetical protein HMPREF9374_3215 [Desmospora sp. 8437]QKI81056.1 hypothetical protein GXN75_03060 [Kroppenstedtia eburnea]